MKWYELHAPNPQYGGQDEEVLSDHHYGGQGEEIFPEFNFYIRSVVKFHFLAG
jgi:hypothetical protein